MNKLKSLWLTLTGSLSSVLPILFSCCKSGACIGVCASPITSLFGISTATMLASPLINVLEPILISISAVSFTISYYTLYVLPKYSCNTGDACNCAPSANEKRNTKISKYIFWIGLIASISFLGYFEYQKYAANINAASSSNATCGENPSSNCCPSDSTRAITSDTASCSSGSNCCDTVPSE